MEKLSFKEKTLIYADDIYNNIRLSKERKSIENIETNKKKSTKKSAPSTLNFKMKKKFSFI